jgi:PXA domain
MLERVIVALVLFSPALTASLWPVLSYLGFVCIVLFLTGYCLFRKVKREPKKHIPFLKSINLKSIKTVEYQPKTTSYLHSALRQTLTFLIQSEGISLIPSLYPLFNPPASGQQSSPQTDMYSKMLQSYLNAKMNITAEMLVGWISHMKDIQLHEHIMNGWLNIVEEHVKTYRKLGNEIEANEPTKQSKKFRHIDDFNDYTVDSEDDATQWSLQLDKCNDQIVNRMKAQGTFHEAAGKGKEVALQYIRGLANQIILVLEGGIDERFNPRSKNESFGTRSNIMKKLIREWIVCRISWPLLYRLSCPDYLNLTVLEHVWIV